MIKDAMNRLTEGQLVELIRDWEEFEQEGSIGECELRTLAGSLNVMGAGSIVLTMERIAFEAYRRVANRYISEFWV
jgi:hypothetical protein